MDGVQLAVRLQAVSGEHAEQANEIGLKIQGVVAVATNLQITDQDGMASAASLITQIATYKRLAEDLRKKLVAPHRAKVQEIDDLFKQVAAPLLRVSGDLETRTLAYRAELRRKAAEEETKRAKLLEMKQKFLDRGKIQAAVAPAPPPPPPDLAKTLHVEGGGSITTRVDWDFEIADPLLVPRQYMEVSETRVRAAVRSGVREIPGVRIFERESLVKRGRRDV